MKTVHLQSDRSIEIHIQGRFHYHTCIPHFGRSIAYHYPSGDVLVRAAGHKIYRLYLHQGQFMILLALSSGDVGEIEGVGIIDVNSAHQLISFGIEGNSTVQFWGPQPRTPGGLLYLPEASLMASSSSHYGPLFVMALALHSDRLSYAIGTL